MAESAREAERQRLQQAEAELRPTPVGLKAEAERVFKLADVTADGLLDIDELQNITGFTKMARNLMVKADLDTNGKVTLCSGFGAKA